MIQLRADVVHYESAQWKKDNELREYERLEKHEYVKKYGKDHSL